MGFFERLTLPEPEPEPAPPARLAWVKPDDVLPAPLAVNLLLARTDDAAVAVTELCAYPTGFSFTLHATVRRDDHAGLMFELMHGPRPRPGGGIPDEFLRLGIQLADGRTASNLTMRYPSVDDGAAPEAPVLVTDSGHGGRRRYDMGYWLWPLPPPGPVVFVVAWPALGIPETTGSLDAAAIRDAAARAVVLWPEHP